LAVLLIKEDSLTQQQRETKKEMQSSSASPYLYSILLLHPTKTSPRCYPKANSEQCAPLVFIYAESKLLDESNHHQD
jgi:hypothetical protein